MDRFIAAFVDRDAHCFIKDTSHNQIHGLYHQISDSEMQYILSELNSAAFTAWKLACINNGCSAGKLCVCTKSQRGNCLMVNHPIVSTASFSMEHNLFLLHLSSNRIVLINEAVLTDKFCYRSYNIH